MKQRGITDFEVIVTDDSKENISKSYVNENFPFVRWIEGSKQGPAANRNNGAFHASGKWLIFLDDDCEPDSNLIFSYNNAIKEASECLVFEGKTISSRNFLHSMETAPINESGGNLWSCNFCIRKDFFIKIKGFDENYLYPHLEDNDLLRRVLQFTKPLFVDTAIVVHPPRLIANGFTLAKHHQSDIYFYKKFNIHYSLYSILKNIAITRLHSVRKNPLTRFTFISFYNMFVELIIVLFNYHKWQKIYSN